MHGSNFGARQGGSRSSGGYCTTVPIRPERMAGCVPLPPRSERRKSCPRCRRHSPAECIDGRKDAAVGRIIAVVAEHEQVAGWHSEDIRAVVNASRRNRASRSSLYPDSPRDDVASLGGAIAHRRMTVGKTRHISPVGQITSDFQKSCQDQESKIFRFTREANQPHNFARLTRLRGARDRHERAVRCGGRERRTRRWRPTLTAKSCGSGAAVLALSPLEAKLLRRRRWQESRSPGRARSKP